MSWQELLQTYLMSLRVQGRSANTLQIEMRWNSMFVLFCEREGALEPSQVTSSHVAAFEQDMLWRRGVRGRFYAPATVDQALRSVRGWMRWAHRQGHLLHDPSTELRLRRPPKPTLIRLLSVAEVERLLQTVEDNVCGVRDRAILETFYGTGVRLGECCALDVGDVDLGERLLHVRYGKGGTQRMLPIGEVLAQALDRWLSEVRPQYLRRPDEAALFVSMMGQRVNAGYLQNIVQVAARRSGLGFPVGPHLLRHAFATHLMAGGADLFSIGRLLGHTSPKSTYIYTHLQPLEVFEEHRRTHPRARRRGGAQGEGSNS